jgi:hypothetical protein
MLQILFLKKNQAHLLSFLFDKFYFFRIRVLLTFNQQGSVLFFLADYLTVLRVAPKEKKFNVSTLNLRNAAANETNC